VSDARHRNRLQAGSRDHSCGMASDATNLLGAVSEIALHQFFGLPIDWTFLATDAGFCQPDVGGLWEVRSTVRPGNRLYLFEREVTLEKLAAPFAWILIEGLGTQQVTCHLQGWAMGYEVITRGVRQQIQRAPSFFLANDRLRRFSAPAPTWRAARWCANSARMALRAAPPPAGSPCLSA
jgi:hypothetical protein